MDATGVPLAPPGSSFRGRAEPHENMFPGLEWLPPMSLRQQQGVREAHWANGEMRLPQGRDARGERLFPTSLVRNLSRLGSFAIPPVGALGLAAQAPDEE
jgi:hypothetical protein